MNSMAFQSPLIRHIGMKKTAHPRNFAWKILLTSFKLAMTQYFIETYLNYWNIHYHWFLLLNHHQRRHHLRNPPPLPLSYVFRVQ